MKLRLQSFTTMALLCAVGFVFFAAVGGMEFAASCRGASFADAIPVEDGGYNEENEGRFVCVTGTPELVKAPSDPLTGVSADGFVLLRSAEMYQYYISDDMVYMGFVASSAEDIAGKNGERYNNPAFPEGFRNAVITGSVRIGGYELDESYLLSMADFFDGFEDGHELLPVTKLKKFPNEFGLIPSGEFYMNSSEDKNRIGDLRLSYRYMPVDSFGEMTFFGIQENGRLVNADGKGYMTDRAVSPSETDAASGEEALNTAKGFFLLAGISLAAGTVSQIRSVRKRKGETAC